MGDENRRADQYEVWSGWATLIWGVLISAIFVVTQMLVMGLYMGANYGDASDEEKAVLFDQLSLDGTVISLATLATFIVGSLVIVGIIQLKKYSDVSRYLGLRLPMREEVRSWLTIFLLLLVLSEVLSYFLGKNESHEFMVSAYVSAQPLWLLWVAMVIAAPVFEELFFRGFLLEGFRHTFMGGTGAVVVTSLFWALIHTQYDLYYITTIFIMGLVLGFARLQSGSVILTIGLHALVNALATLQTAYLV